MKRSIKNIITVFVIILGIASIFVTANLSKNSQNSSSQNGSQGMNNSNQTPPDMPSGNNQTPPSGNSSNDSNSSSSSSESNNSSSSDNSNSNESSGQQMPGGNQGSNVPQMPGGGQGSNGQQMPGSNSEQNNSNDSQIIYYVIYGVEGFVISSAFIYLLLSHFNKKTFKETFSNKDKIIIEILSVIILTAVITFVSLNIKTETKSSNVTYTASKEITTDTTVTSGTYSSSKSDENAIIVDGSKSTISNIKVNKTGNSNSGDNSNFYGNNSAILAKNKANLTLKNITVTTKADGANGVFSYGGSATTNNSSSDGTTVNISDSKITTTGDNAGGIMTTGGGKTNATNLIITTSGTSSAAIRTDRGGGEVTVNKGTYTTNGKGSPAIYSTANISVKNAKLISNVSEGVVIEGKNTVTLNNCTLTDTNSKLNGKSTTYKNIFIYQSMSGDASEGTATFTSKNSTIITNKGDSFYVTNTSAEINLENNKIVNNDKSGNFLRIQKDSWGNSGSNGGDVILNMTKQSVKGNIEVDEISSLIMNLKTNSYYEGTINGSNSAKSIKLSLDKTSKIKLTSDSYVSSLTDEDESYSNIDFNGYKLYVNGKAIN